MASGSASADAETVETEDTDSSGTTQAVDGIEIFEDEELHHDIQPSLLGTISEHGFFRFMLSGGLVPYLTWKNTRNNVTSERLIDKQGGVSGTTTKEVQFDDIVGDITTRQSALEARMNRGTIEFEIEKQRRTGATHHDSTDREIDRSEMGIERSNIEITGVKDHQEVTNTIRRIARSK